MAKNLVYSPILAQIHAAIFFFKNLVLSVTRYHGQLSLCTISEKTDDPILRKFTNQRTNREIDESDFIRRCSSNVECPINF